MMLLSVGAACVCMVVHCTHEYPFCRPPPHGLRSCGIKEADLTQASPLSPAVRAVLLVATGLDRAVRDGAEAASVTMEEARSAVTERARLLMRLPLPGVDVCHDAEVPWWANGAFARMNLPNTHIRLRAACPPGEPRVCACIAYYTLSSSPWLFDN
jgi:hypothetical protein